MYSSTAETSAKLLKFAFNINLKISCWGKTSNAKLCSQVSTNHILHRYNFQIRFFVLLKCAAKFVRGLKSRERVHTMMKYCKIDTDGNKSQCS